MLTSQVPLTIPFALLLCEAAFHQSIPFHQGIKKVGQFSMLLQLKKNKVGCPIEEENCRFFTAWYLPSSSLISTKENKCQGQLLPGLNCCPFPYEKNACMAISHPALKALETPNKTMNPYLHTMQIICSIPGYFFKYGLLEDETNIWFSIKYNKHLREAASSMESVDYQISQNFSWWTIFYGAMHFFKSGLQ